MATLKAMFKLFDGYSRTISTINKKTDEATNKILRASGVTDEFNDKLKNMGASANVANSGLGKFISLAATIAGAIKGINLIDEYTNTAARLDLINDGLQDQAELQEKIFAAANRSRGAYSNMANAIAKMGLLAGEAFTSNDELIAFTELLQKSFKVGGASASEQASAMLQLTQAMAAGRLQGDEFRSIMENAPMIADAIAKYMGKTKGELKEMSAQGIITADVIKNAMFMAAGDINDAFREMPMTFADIWNRIKNAGTQAFSGVMVSINKLINTEGFQKFINGITIGFEFAAKAVDWLVNAIATGWDTIGPILGIIGGVLLVAIITKLWAMIPPLIAQAGAWLAVYWPLLLIIGVIALVISAARQLGATWEQIIGFVGGVLGVFVTYFYNGFVYIWNAVAAFVNFFGNVFKNPVASVQALFYDLMVNVLGFIETMARGIEALLNKIPGIEINITSGITNLRDKFAAKSATIKDENDLVEFVQSKEFMDYSEGFAKGRDFGKNLYTNISDKLGSLTDTMTGLGAEFDMSNFGTPANPITVQGTGSGGKVEVDMADEDLKYLRDIAQREYINKFTTATLAPNISIKFGDVRETADADKVAKRIRKILQEEIAMAAEGVYS
ncbi:MAG: Phage tape measure protein [Clostridium sp.]